jgi:SET domain-containing protein
VARFLNHSCKPNLMSQPVLRQGDSGLRYCIALVSTE